MAQSKAYLAIIGDGGRETFIVFDENPIPRKADEYIKLHLPGRCDPAILDYLLECVDKGDFLCFEVPYVDNTYVRHSDYD